MRRRTKPNRHTGGDGMLLSDLLLIFLFSFSPIKMTVTHLGLSFTPTESGLNEFEGLSGWSAVSRNVRCVQVCVCSCPAV